MTIYKKTELGQRAFKDRSNTLSARQRAAFILIDGKRPMQSVVEATSGMGIGPEDFVYLLSCGYIAAASDAPVATQAMANAPAPSAGAAAVAPLVAPVVTSLPAPGVAPAGAPVPAPSSAPAAAAVAATAATSGAVPLTPQALYMRAYQLATQLAASLGLRGFRLNLAVESASGYEQLVALLPRLREAVGPERCAALEQALRP